MLVALKELIIQLILDLYQAPVLVGILTLGLLSAVLITIQFFRQSDTKIPGIAGVIVGIAEIFHLIAPDTIARGLENILVSLTTPQDGTPFSSTIEPLFAFFVGDPDYRSIFDESIFVGILAYLASVLVVSVIEYRKTGVIIGSLSPATFSSKVARPKRSTTNELGSGDFATTEQISRWTRPSTKSSDTIIHVSDLRGSEGIAFKQAKLVIPRDIRNRHMLIIAKTGSGKTTKLIHPIIYSDCMCPVSSTIVIDSKPEMWKKHAAMTRKYNPDKHIMLFNPLDLARTYSWNILSKIENDTDSKLIANTIIGATDNPASKGDSPFFRNNALAILNAIMVGLLNDPNDKLSMPRIHELVQSGMKALCDWLESHPQAIRNSRSFVELARSGSQNADTIMSELSMRLSAWDIHAIRASTALDELNLNDLVERPSLFIVELRESELEMLRPMANVIVVEILRFLTKRAESCPGSMLPRPVGLVIDEFASALGRLPDIHVKLNTLRSRNVSIVAAVQSLAQIKANYGENADSVISGFSTKIFMPTLDVSDSEWASKETGQMTVRFQTNSVGVNKKLIEVFASKNDSKNEQVQQRAVLTPDEIGRPVDNIETFFMPNTPVFQGFLTPFYKIPEMLKRMTEFDSEAKQLKLRETGISFVDEAPKSPPPAAAAGAAPANGLPPGISDTRGWSDEQIMKKYTETRAKLDWDNTTGSARKWWEAFENENKQRSALVLRLAEELSVRAATVTEFFLAYVYSNTDNIQANLNYLDYLRLKKEEEKKKRAATEKAPPGSGGNSGSEAA